MTPHEQLLSYFQSKTHLSPEEFSEFKDFFVLKKVKRNELLLREGEVCTFNLFVLSGLLRMYHIGPEGQEFTRYFAFENKFGTSLTSLIEGMPSIENIQAVEKSEVLKISKVDFFKLVETVPSVNLIYKNILEQAYITSQKRIYDFQGKTALERLKWLLSHQPGILNRIPSRLVASYLGITSYTLSRIKAEL
ncbi:cAMP-binding domain of CRP or a regulatory subunit of cAMP-dependent protein kinases [Algoriphagus alkaliphilus]|uniref:cAMP-binding domain of CRP or a regulatory subunit of cAMP-dependent protein kinases n=1 Tax=Algoriphagus alkaliphilus TaxID=279824 RepID=A0A1G5ZHV5_9BACT|nr:Crp/Fnr family transcriptional regulator [Algoriphagus alkaliphilus]MBA4302078.1 Crp/Fnr family transcriptional regulator [Cyclobacterium sp.]SDA94344.1 cAMP-binding domain of CRP or a regulatory subunit of cAMP-dependent protein kinases [Algoriphagus alkaliphilus]